MQLATTGFREYDARWRFPEEIDLAGLRRVGLALAAFLGNRGRIIAGHDYRSYSEAVEAAVIDGLLAGGMEVCPIGLAITPMVWFACAREGVPCGVMVTASHNENGWTGLKMARNAPLPFTAQDTQKLKDLALGGDLPEKPGGRVAALSGMAEHYTASLTGTPLAARQKLVIACGNGTAGAFAPQVFSALGAEVVPLHCDLDAAFPHYNPNPEHEEMMRDTGAAVRQTGADMGLAFDGDGDRCGFTDENGRNLSPDKVGLLLARTMAKKGGDGWVSGGRIIADIKSTGLFSRDAVLREAGIKAEYWKTGHSWLKARLVETSALAAFEKSGHFYFAPPYGEIYDDGIVSGINICRMVIDEGKSLGALYDALPPVWISPTLDPFCPDDKKYAVAARALAHYEAIRAGGGKLAGRAITDILTINGARVILEDGSWLLVRASSNNPALALVAESVVSRSDMQLLAGDMLALVQSFDGVGEPKQGL